jgi:hypothetical protein
MKRFRAQSAPAAIAFCARGAPSVAITRWIALFRDIEEL